MSYEFLNGYQIPTLHQPAPFEPNSPETLNTHEEQPQITDNVTSLQYSNTNRFIPPGLHETNYLPSARPCKRKVDTKFESGVIVSADGELVLFQGRDPSYPNELNKLIHPIYCELCHTHANSVSTAKEHYESKAHDRNISSWLKKNYTDKGLDPPVVKRFLKSGPHGPNAFHCTLCDLKLMSLAHASQHYAGRKHRLVANKISQPSGSGYYNMEGQWVRTGTKYVPVTGNDGRFGIGEQFKSPPATVAPIGEDASLSTTVVVQEGEIIQSQIEADNAAAMISVPLYCRVCKVRTTSEFQMKMHMQGAKHKKKINAAIEESSLKQIVSLGQRMITAVAVLPKSGTLSDSINEKVDNTTMSMYRTPSGSYYCKICNLSLGHVTALQQHLKGKKHLKKISENNEKAKVNAKNTTGDTPM